MAIDVLTLALAKKMSGSGSGGIEVTGASVGQTIVVKAVDDNGKPTEWEAADLPQGGGVTPTAAEKIVDYTVDADGATAVSFTFTVSDYPKLAQYNRLRGVVKKSANVAMPWVNVILNDTRNQSYPGTNIIGSTAAGSFGMFGFDITKNGSYFMGGVTTLANPSLYPGFTSCAFAALAQKRFTPLYLSELQYIVIASYTAFLDEGATIEIWGWNE